MVIMKQFIKKYLGWLKNSNRPKHVKYGMLAFIAMLMTSLVLGVPFVLSTVIALVAITIVAIAVDYKDKLYGNKFDWLDVLATILFPAIFTLITLIIDVIL